MQTLLKVFLVICGSYILSPVALAEQVIYQWRDSNNELHVSQLPPANVEYQTIILGSKSHSPSVTAPVAMAKKAAIEVARNCTKAQDNLRILQQDLPVYIDLEDGNKELLDESKREQQRQLAQSQIQMYCDKAATPTMTK